MRNIENMQKPGTRKLRHGNTNADELTRNRGKYTQAGNTAEHNQTRRDSEKAKQNTLTQGTVKIKQEIHEHGSQDARNTR